MAEQVELQNLPADWECRFDSRSGRYYYINHVSRTTTWDDPRGRYKQIQDATPAPTISEHIPLQPLHGSPYHVYPARNYPAVQAAFQVPTSGVPSVSASPQLAAKLPQLEMSPLSRVSSYNPNRTPVMSQLARQQNSVQETSFSTSSNNVIDTEATVAKINTMFPTVNDNHIRLLLKKYYNREAVVISALQVEKHPLTTPGPFATPPPPGRHFYNQISTQYHMTPPMGRDITSVSRNDSPIPGRPASSCANGSYGSPRFGDAYRSSPKPHSSPKMKLRYMKGIFPKAEETLILDILANSDNNVQKASETLIQMGYDKRDTPNMMKMSLKKKEAENARKLEIERIELEKEQHKVKTSEEKNKIKLRLQSQYKTVAERIISMALESVDYSEEKASQILNIVMQENDTQNHANNASHLESMQSSTNAASVAISGNIESAAALSSAQSRSSSCRSSNKIMQQHREADGGGPSSKSSVAYAGANLIPHTYDDNATTPNSDDSKLSSNSKDEVISPNGSRTKQNRPKIKIDHAKITPDIDEGMKNDFKTIVSCMSAKGPNTEYCNGPNDNLLLVDYVTWRGANSDLVAGRRGLARGPMAKNRSCERTYTPRGANSELCNGPVMGLAKGSIYSQITHGLANVKVN